MKNKKLFQNEKQASIYMKLVRIAMLEPLIQAEASIMLQLGDKGNGHL